MGNTTYKLVVYHMDPRKHNEPESVRVLTYTNDFEMMMDYTHYLRTYECIDAFVGNNHDEENTEIINILKLGVAKAWRNTSSKAKKHQTCISRL